MANFITQSQCGEFERNEYFENINILKIIMASWIIFENIVYI